MTSPTLNISPNDRNVKRMGDDAKEVLLKHTLDHLQAALTRIIEAEKASRGLRMLGIPAKCMKPAVRTLVNAMTHIQPDIQAELKDIVDAYAVHN